ncbi:hypothetical protein SSP24_34200 [Streptomyces spinoverrucosus]|uniref:Uncharacterized protein n=1 Tax=Streptomyces spinoverrucosus TaxID=284043 RepID=A0A4Y3VHX9_9ACTN|nr:hypothetical protein [Streptomyces spinoverrucosus]GEC05765.1 hypothetical protein SSP24_34200 [Streptomyces spinoverrucosus]GHB82775.1 hypothetical protein GCM10010397_62500 [Streptomyces spinoverrucosus]
MSTAPGPTPAAPPPPRRPQGDPQYATPGTSPWGASRRPAGERATSRVRKIAEGLPDWEPLPPGETLVRRPGGTV